MVFNSYIFVFLFLPLSMLIYHQFQQRGYAIPAKWFLVLASLVFYGVYNIWYVAILTGSVLVNFLLGKAIAVSHQSRKKWLMAGGVTANILLLAYFKYTNFLFDNINTLFSSDLHLTMIIIPVAVSFFTLQQVAYLVDLYRGEARDHDLLEYSLFVTFFPKLIAGPIVRMRELIPQIKTYLPLTKSDIAIGLTVFFLGLFKKVVLADGIEAFVSPVFSAASAGTPISFFNGWSGALTYTFQIYFDFSGYSDMAIGLGVLFGLRLPLNFYSPYKSTGIIDFWRRWHITLSHFIRDYIYISLGGNRRGFARQVLYLLIAMTIAGLWHGAGWTFVIWGAMHGIYLAINHLWRKVRGPKPDPGPRVIRMISILITFLSVSVAWVFFRADSVGTAIEIIKGIAGLNGFVLPSEYLSILGPVSGLLENIGFSSGSAVGFNWIAVVWILVSMAICWLLPNVQEYMAEYKPSFDAFEQSTSERWHWRRWNPSVSRAVAIGIIAVVAILFMNHVSSFIYAQF